MPVEVAGPADGVAIRPEAALLGRSLAGVEVVDGRFIDLESGGLEKVLPDGLPDGWAGASWRWSAARG
jgi:hypothetical protein